MANNNFINWRDNLKTLFESIFHYILKLIRELYIKLIRVIKSFH